MRKEWELIPIEFNDLCWKIEKESIIDKNSTRSDCRV
jgi:hypothetical protein